MSAFGVRGRLERLAARDVVDDLIVTIPVDASDDRRRRTIDALAPAE